MSFFAGRATPPAPRLAGVADADGSDGAGADAAEAAGAGAAIAAGGAEGAGAPGVGPGFGEAPQESASAATKAALECASCEFRFITESW